MDATVSHNMDLMIQKVMFEKPSGWQFKVRNYKKVKEILLGNKDTIQDAESGFANIEDVKSFYIKLFQQNGYKNPTKIMKKVLELYTKYLDGGRDNISFILNEVESFTSSPAAGATDVFSRIYGIGPAKIKALVDKGIYTIDKLREECNKETKLLNNKQKIGLKFYEDLNERIPRREITTFRKKVEKAIYSKYGNNIQITIAGSYRRGASTSGDMDMLITSQKYEHEALPRVLGILNELGMVQETLAKGNKKFMGIIKVGTGTGCKARHLDIVETTYTDYPFAMLYFTGSAQHNIQMRALALKKGYSLNEYDMTLKGTRTRVPDELVEKVIGKHRFESEEDIFRFLGLKYKEPHKRIKL